jgi:single-stranded DNA-binding protein
MNVLTLAGRVASNPVRRETTRGVVCEFRLAVDCRPRLWIVVQTWGQMAGRAAQHVTTGRTIAVSGALINESYATRSGETAVRWYVRATSLTYLDRPAEAENELAEAAS